MNTLTDIAKQLKDIADSLTQLSQDIVKTHGELGNQLQDNQPQQSSTDIQKPLAETPPTSKQGE